MPKIPPHVKKLAKEAVDFDDATNINAYDKLKNQKFMDKNGKIGTFEQFFPRQGNDFTISFSFSGCSLYCPLTNPALAKMGPNWKHVVINVQPENQGFAQETRNAFYEAVTKPRDISGKRVGSDVPNVTVLFPVDGNNRLSNAAAFEIQQNAFSLSATKTRHNPMVLKFCPDGNLTEITDPNQITGTTKNAGCGR